MLRVDVVREHCQILLCESLTSASQVTQEEQASALVYCGSEVGINRGEKRTKRRAEEITKEERKRLSSY